MAGFVGVLVSDPWLQSQFTQVELRTLKSGVSIPHFFLLFFVANNLAEDDQDFGLSHETICLGPVSPYTRRMKVVGSL